VKYGKGAKLTTDQDSELQIWRGRVEEEKCGGDNTYYTFFFLFVFIPDLLPFAC
jgi:hypothetical protein